MFITSHVLTGAALGTKLPPVPAFLAGVASHLLMDNLPHWGLGPHGDWLPVARRDGVVGLVALGASAALAPPGRKLSVLAGMTGACLPDTDKIGLHFVGRSPWPRAFDAFHSWIQREAAHRLPHEIAVAGALAVVAAGLLRAPRAGQTCSRRNAKRRRQPSSASVSP